MYFYIYNINVFLLLMCRSIFTIILRLYCEFYLILIMLIFLTKHNIFLINDHIFIRTRKIILRLYCEFYLILCNHINIMFIFLLYIYPYYLLMNIFINFCLFYSCVFVFNLIIKIWWNVRYFNKSVRSYFVKNKYPVEKLTIIFRAE